MKKQKAKCEVCGARRWFAGSTTCDPICARAKAAGCSRGVQIMLELRETLAKPWSNRKPRNPYAYQPGNNYNQPA